MRCVNVLDIPIIISATRKEVNRWGKKNFTEYCMRCPFFVLREELERSYTGERILAGKKNIEGICTCDDRPAWLTPVRIPANCEYIEWLKNSAIAAKRLESGGATYYVVK